MNSRIDPTTTAETPEQLIEHISRLMAEAEAMIAGPVTQRPDGRMSEMKHRLAAARDGLNRAYTTARHNVVAGARYTDATIREYPYYSIGIAFGVGIALGIFAGRARRGY